MHFDTSKDVSNHNKNKDIRVHEIKKRKSIWYISFGIEIIWDQRFFTIVA